jgi:hypothetical protein
MRNAAANNTQGAQREGVFWTGTFHKNRNILTSYAHTRCTLASNGFTSSFVGLGCFLLGGRLACPKGGAAQQAQQLASPTMPNQPLVFQAASLGEKNWKLILPTTPQGMAKPGSEQVLAPQLPSRPGQQDSRGWD